MSDTVIAWPATLTPEDDGSFTVSFADWPEALTCGDDEAEALSMAADALAEAAAGRLRLGEVIPAPRKAHKGEHLIIAPADVAARLALALEIQSQGLTRTEVARRMGKDEKTVRRILSPAKGDRASIDLTHAALRALGVAPGLVVHRARHA